MFPWEIVVINWTDFMSIPMTGHYLQHCKDIKEHWIDLNSCNEWNV